MCPPVLRRTLSALVLTLACTLVCQLNDSSVTFVSWVSLAPFLITRRRGHVKAVVFSPSSWAMSIIYIITYNIIYRAPGVANGNNHFLFQALHFTRSAGNGWPSRLNGDWLFYVTSPTLPEGSERWLAVSREWRREVQIFQLLHVSPCDTFQCAAWTYSKPWIQVLMHTITPVFSYRLNLLFSHTQNRFSIQNRFLLKNRLSFKHLSILSWNCCIKAISHIASVTKISLYKNNSAVKHAAF